jgi:hypothetical protein
MSTKDEQDQPSSATEDDVKRRYREALERKNAGSTQGSAHTDNDGGNKAHDAHGPAKAQRQFRRKSGG